MLALRIALTVAEIVLLVAVLAYFLRKLTGLLSHIGGTLENISAGVVAIEGHVTPIGPGADELNRRLGDAAGHLGNAAEAAEKLAR